MTEQTVTLTSDGIRVEEERKAPLSDETRKVIVDEIDWGEFPVGNLIMEIEHIEPISSESRSNSLEGFRFHVANLESTNESPERPVKEFWDSVEKETGISWQGGNVILDGEKSAKDNLVAFVEFLLDNDYLVREDLPIESGWKRNLINTEPFHKNGEEMVQYESVGGEIYLETKYSRDAIKQKIVELGQKFGK